MHERVFILIFRRDRQLHKPGIFLFKQSWTSDRINLYSHFNRLKNTTNGQQLTEFQPANA